MQNSIQNAKDSQTKQRKRSLPYSLLLLVPIIPLSCHWTAKKRALTLILLGVFQRSRM